MKTGPAALNKTVTTPTTATTIQAPLTFETPEGKLRPQRR